MAKMEGTQAEVKCDVLLLKAGSRCVQGLTRQVGHSRATAAPLVGICHETNTSSP